MTEVVTQSAKEVVTFLTFRIGSSPVNWTYVRVCDVNADMRLGTDLYKAVPQIDIDYAVQTGGIKEDDTKITVATDSHPWFDTFSDGRARPRVKVYVAEMQRSDIGFEGAKVTYPFTGYVAYPRRNPDGAAGRTQLVCKNAKQLLEVPLGVSANHRCDRIFGSEGCGKDLSALALVVTCVGFSGTTVVFEDGGGAGGALKGKSPGYWVKGWVEFEGLRLLVADWSGPGSGTFRLNKTPPPDWEGELVKLVPGCDGLWTTCDVRWANGPNFRAMGIAIPAHHVNFEVPT